MENKKQGMTPEQMKQRSQEKVDQIVKLMETLQVRCEAREHIDQQGFLQRVVFWVDEEQYPEKEPETQEDAPEPEVKDKKDA